MANLNEKHQRELMKQALYGDQRRGAVAGRPRARVSQSGQQPQNAAGRPRSMAAQGFEQPQPAARTTRRPQAQPQPQPPVQRQAAQRVRQQPVQPQWEEPQWEEPQWEEPQWEEPVYESSAYDPNSPVRKKPRKNVGGWILLGIIVVLALVAAFLVYMLVTGKLAIGGGGGTKAPALPDGNPVLAQTEDAGQQYVDETLFIGDSNTVRYRMYSLVDPSMVAAKESIGAADLVNDSFIEVTGQDEPLSIAKTMGLVQPTRMLVMVGTNDVGNRTAEDFTGQYEAAIKELQKQAPKADIVIAAIPPVDESYAAYDIGNQAIQEYNAALKEMCGRLGVPYLDTWEALSDGNSQAIAGYTDDGLHLTQDALTALLQHYRTHAWNP